MLCAESLQEICTISKVSHSATLNIRVAISAYNGFLASRPDQKYKQLHKCLKDADEKVDFVTMMDTKSKMEELVKLHPELDKIDLKTIQLVEGADDNPDAENLILTMLPKNFKIALLKEIEDGTIILEIDSLNISTTTCGNGCTVNLKVARLLEQKYGIKSASSKCGSHLSAGTTCRLCTTYWGSTHMVDFLDACTEASSIILLFLDTLVTGQIHEDDEDETKYLASPTDIYHLQLFADLYPIFTYS